MRDSISLILGATDGLVKSVSHEQHSASLPSNPQDTGPCVDRQRDCALTGRTLLLITLRIGGLQMRSLLIVLVLAIMSGGFVCPAAAQGQNHEAWTKGVIDEFRGEISSLNSKTDKNSVEDLAKLIDLHSKYEDYIIKANQAQHLRDSEI